MSDLKFDEIVVQGQYLVEFFYSDLDISQVLEEEPEKVLKEYRKKIENYEVYLFDVAVSKIVANDFKFGTQYLGGNLYSNYEEFIKDEYCHDMIENCKQESAVEIKDFMKILSKEL